VPLVTLEVAVNPFNHLVAKFLVHAVTAKQVRQSPGNNLTCDA